MINSIIIYDTNLLCNYPDIKKFEYCKNYGEIDLNNKVFELFKFIQRNNLSDSIIVAIPDIVIKEIIFQQKNKYYALLELMNYAKTLPESHIEVNHINYEKYLKDIFEEFILSNNISVIPIPSSNVVEKLLQRIYGENPAPFIVSNTASDRGFKDALIWESILHYDYTKYDNVYFQCKDSGFTKMCEIEFNTYFPDVNFKKLSSSKDIVDILINDYKIDSDLDEVKRIAFSDIIENISNDFDKKRYILIDGKKQAIKSYEIIDLIYEEPTFVSSDMGYSVLTKIQVVINNMDVEVICESFVFPKGGVNDHTYDYELLI